MEKPKELLLERFILADRQARMRDVASKRTRSITIVLDEIRNVHNISAIIRTADAFGVLDVHLLYKEFDSSKGVTQGAERWLKIHKHESAEELIIELKNQGFKIVILAPKDNIQTGNQSVPIFSLPFSEKLALVFGNEKHGVGEAFQKAADYSAYIPMFGFVESLNVSVACAISLFCSGMSGAKDERQVTCIDSAEQEALYASWLLKEVPQAGLVLERLVKDEAAKNSKS